MSLVPEVFEEWIAYPDKRTFVLTTDHLRQASQPGWWCSGWRGNFDAAEYRRLYPPIKHPLDE